MDEDVEGIEPVADGLVELHPTREQTNQRLDRFVAASLPELSRTYVQRLIEAGNVRVDGVLRRSTFKMTPGEVISVDVPPPRVDRIEPEAIPLAIVYEDDDVIVLDKPAGLVVHPAPGHPSGTLVNALLYHAPGISVGGSNRPGIVHRLDKGTSGLMVVAKTDRARNTLVAQWAERSVKKGYVALADGVVESDEGTVDVPIGRDPTQRQRMAALPRGRSAISHFAVRRRFERFTLLDVEIETGRTHQIRVHLAFIGHPVVGDPVYGRPKSEATSGLRRQFLHASRLAFRLPDGREVSFASTLPDDLKSAMDALGAGEAPAERSTTGG